MFAARGLVCKLCGSCALRRINPASLSIGRIHIRGKKDLPAVNDEQKEIPGLMSSRYETFKDEDSPVILDIEEERRIVEDTQEQELRDEFEGINLKRGVTGVFDIQEVVDILRQEKGKDIFVCKVPDHFNYVEYLVIATGRSSKHMFAMLEFIRKIFKKKMINGDYLPMIEGKNSKHWMAIDLGNIAVHIFSQSERKVYDLESLWSVGKEYDSEYQKNNQVTTNIVTQYENLLASLTPDNSNQNTAESK